MSSELIDGLPRAGSSEGGGLIWDCDVDPRREVGREKFGGLDEGGDDGIICLGGGELEFQLNVVAVSEEVVWGESGRNGPSNAPAGETDRLPGIVSRPRPPRVTGGDE